MATMPTAGDLRHQVAIQMLPDPPTADDSGQHDTTDGNYQTIAVRRARIRDLSGGEVWYAKQVVAEVNLAVDLRYFPKLAEWKRGENLGPKMRLVEMLNGEEVRTLNVGVVRNPDGKKIFHLVLCKA